MQAQRNLRVTQPIGFVMPTPMGRVQILAKGQCGSAQQIRIPENCALLVPIIP